MPVMFFFDGINIFVLAEEDWRMQQQRWRNTNTIEITLTCHYRSKSKQLFGALVRNVFMHEQKKKKGIVSCGRGDGTKEIDQNNVRKMIKTPFFILFLFASF